jgi:hypothetical protein
MREGTTTQTNRQESMNKFIIATAAATALIASFGIANAQTWQNDGSGGYRGRMMIDRNVALQTNRGWMSSGTGQPGGPMATTPGTNSHAGAGRGTTGTGQQGGSGNE